MADRPSAASASWRHRHTPPAYYGLWPTDGGPLPAIPSSRRGVSRLGSPRGPIGKVAVRRFTLLVLLGSVGILASPGASLAEDPPTRLAPPVEEGPFLRPVGGVAAE